MQKAQKAQKIKTSNGLKLQVVNPDAAGIDVSSSEMQVCVPMDRDADYNRKFGVFTEDLQKIGSWLQECCITTVSMESTGIYWVPLYMHLTSIGIEVYLVNAKSVSNFTENKDDDIDAENLMLLHSYGLLKPSYQVDNFAREIRDLSRHRDNLTRTSSKEVLHMQKSMELMNIKLCNVLSDITGKSGEDIINAILSGERDTAKLAELADFRCKTPKDIIAKSLEGNWNESLLFALKQSRDLYQYIQAQIKECEQKMELLFKKYCSTISSDDTQIREILRSKKRVQKKNEVRFDVEQYGCEIFGVNLMRLPGISHLTVLKLSGELGHNFTEKFQSHKQFSKWLNTVPVNKISAGKIISSKLPKRKNPVGQILREVATTLSCSKTPWGDYYRKVRSRKGPNGANVATANKLAKVIYTMVKTQTEYDEKMIMVDEPESLKKQINSMKKKIAQLQEKVDACEITPKSQSA